MDILHVILLSIMLIDVDNRYEQSVNSAHTHHIIALSAMRDMFDLFLIETALFGIVRTTGNTILIFNISIRFMIQPAENYFT